MGDLFKGSNIVALVMSLSPLVLLGLFAGLGVQSSETASIAASVVSVVLAIVAITLSVIFYIKSKDTEANAAKAMESIKSQTTALEKLTAKWMDRLTQYATQPSSADALLPQVMMALVSRTPDGASGALANVPTDVPSRMQWLEAELPAVMTVSYFYSCIANTLIQRDLPELDNTEDDNEAMSILNQSFADISYVDNILANEDLLAIFESSRNAGMLKMAREKWRPKAKNAFMTHKAQIEKKGEPET